MPDYRPPDLQTADTEEPTTGNPMDFRWGGPIVSDWQQTMEQTKPGLFPGDRPFEGVGKTDVADILPFTPVTPSALQRDTQPTFLEPDQPGLFESIGYGVNDLIGSVIPFFNESEHRENFAKLGGWFLSHPDNLLDLIFSASPNAGDIKGDYEALPEDDLKRKYDLYIAKDPINAMKYMAQYIESRGFEHAQNLGVNQMFRDMVIPSTTVSEWLRRGLLGLISMPSQLSNRAINTALGGGHFKQILDTPREQLPEGLAAMRDRYLSGEMNADEFQDELTMTPWRWTLNEGWAGAFGSLALDIFTDPITLVSLGIGKAGAVAGKSGALARVRVANIVRMRGLQETALKWAESTGRKFVDQSDALFEYAREFEPDLLDEGISTLTRREQFEFKADPILQPAARIANSIDNMFDWFGTSAIARRFSGNITTNFGRGWLNFHGIDNVKLVQDFYRGIGASGQSKFERHLAVALLNEKAALMQQNISNEVLARAEEWSGAGVSPDEVVRARMDVGDSLFSEGELAAGRWAESWLPSGKVGEKVMREARANYLTSLVPDLQRAAGSTESAARSLLEKANDKTLSFVHRLIYGAQIIEFREAKRIALQNIDTEVRRLQQIADEDKAAIQAWKDAPGPKKKKGPPPKVRLSKEEIEFLANAESHKESVSRYTLVSERALTRDRARLLLDATGTIDQESFRIIDEAIDKYDVLNINFRKASLSPEERRVWVRDFVEDLMGRDNALPVIVNRGSLPTEVLDSLYGRYEIGLTPTDKWGITRTDDGALRGVNTFIDLIDDSADPAQVSRAFSRKDVFRSKWFEGIRGSRLYYEARDRFVKKAIRSYGLSAHDSKTLFEAIRREAFKRNIGPRGFKSSDLIEIARSVYVNMEPAIAARVGERGLLELNAYAWEGELRSVGLTSKASGYMKRKGARRTDNLVGRISEDLYIKMRFAMSPVFIAMEVTEGPFFAILRGIKPGIKWSADDIRANSILSYMRTGEFMTDQTERAQLWHLDQQAAIRIFPADSMMVRGWKQFLPERIKPKPKLKMDTRVRGLTEFKELLYVRQAFKDAAEEMITNWRKNAPGLLAKWEEILGTNDPRRIVLAYMEDRGAFNPSMRAGLHMMDAAKPLGLGRREPIRIGDVANFHGFETIAEMRASIRDGSYAEGDFFRKYSELGLDSNYAERAWNVSSGFEESEWVSSIREAFDNDTLSVNTFLNFHRWLARRAKMSFEEYMNTNFGELVRSVAKSADIPAGALKQSVRQMHEMYGWDYHGPGDARFERISARSREVISDPFPETSKKAQKQIKKIRELSDPAKAEKVAPPMSPWRQRMTLEARVADIIRIFENNEKEMLDASQWYREMPSLMIGFADHMPIGVIQGLSRRWWESAEERMYTREVEEFVPELDKDGNPVFDENGEPEGEIAIRRVRTEERREGPNDFEKYFGTVEDRIAKARESGNQELLDVLEGRVTREPTVLFFRPRTIKKVKKKDVLKYQTGKDYVSSPTWDPSDVRHVVDESAMRDELASRLLVAFAGTQQNMSVAEGFNFVTRMSDISSVMKHNPNNLKFGMSGPTEKVARMLDEFDRLVEFGTGAKLSDFIDTLSGKGRTRTISEKVGDTLQPGAMDIWMKRAWGYLPPEYFNLLVQHAAWEKGIGVAKLNADSALRKQIEDEVLADRGYTREMVEKTSADPSDAEYVWLLMRTNEIKDYLNEVKFLNRDDWEAHEVQSLLWVGEQKRFARSATSASQSPPNSVLSQVGIQTAVEALRPNTYEVKKAGVVKTKKGEQIPWSIKNPDGTVQNVFPPNDMLDQMYGGEADNVRASITRDVFDVMVPLVERYTGATLVHRIDAVGTWTPEGGRETTFSPNMTVVLTGSDAQTEAAAALLAYSLRQESVYAITRPPEASIRGKLQKNKDGSSKTVVPRSDITKGRYWTMNYALPVGQKDRGTYIQLLSRYIDLVIEIADMRGEYPGSMFGLMDDGSIAMRMAWESGKNKAFAEERSVHVKKLESIDAEIKTSEERLKILASDLKTQKDNLENADNALAAAVDRIAKKEATANQKAAKAAIRSIEKETKQLTSLLEKLPKQKAKPEKALAEIGSKMSEEDIVNLGMIPKQFRDALENGTWIRGFAGLTDEQKSNPALRGFDENAEPLPVSIKYEQMDTKFISGKTLQRIDELGTREGTPADVASLLSQTATDATYAAYSRHAPDALEQHRRGAPVDDGSPVYFQRENGVPTGPARAAFVRDIGDSRSAYYFVNRSSDVTSAIHETMHFFLKQADLSVLIALAKEYNKAHPSNTVTVGINSRGLPPHVEEWVAYEFEKYAASDQIPEFATYAGVFKGVAEWAKEKKLTTGTPLAELFDGILDRDRDIPGTHWNADEQRAWEAARIAFLRAEDQAHSTAFYRRSRSWFERSINHPYLGLYPASYMWGKVLPELTRFLVRRPFGLKAPLGGLMMANHVWRNVQMQVETDEELRKWLEEHPETIRFFTLMVPGTPWEIPVNAPLAIRRASEEYAEATLNGKEPNQDLANSLTDMITYAAGITQLPRRLADIGSEFNAGPDWLANFGLANFGGVPGSNTPTAQTNNFEYEPVETR